MGLLKVINRFKYRNLESDEEFENRLKRIQSMDGNHMVLITAMIAERNRIKDLLK